jgi:hypothetical protein
MFQANKVQQSAYDLARLWCFETVPILIVILVMGRGIVRLWRNVKFCQVPYHESFVDTTSCWLCKYPFSQRQDGSIEFSVRIGLESLMWGIASHAKNPKGTL